LPRPPRAPRAEAPGAYSYFISVETWREICPQLEALFNQLHNLSDVAEIVRISAEHEVNFLPPEANE
jgi:hypothetical protein